MITQQTDIESRLFDIACDKSEDQLRRVFEVIVSLGNPRDLEPMERCAVLKDAVAAIQRIVAE